MANSVHLDDRGVLRVSGEDARNFLDNIVTCNLKALSPENPRFGALLTPQGKLLVDFIAAEAPAEDGGALFLDCPGVLAADLAKRLGMYKLRAKATVENLSDSLGVVAVFGDGAEARSLGDLGLAYRDPRSAALGFRVICEKADAEKLEGFPPAAGAVRYHALRIAAGVPQGGIDFIRGDAFPHEANMDLLGGVDFGKGCYIGQEIVSRMQHRGTARTRILKLAYEGGFGAEPGAEIKAGDRLIGRAGSSADGQGLALIRADRAMDAIAAGETITSGGIAVTVTIPDAIRAQLAAKAKTAQ